MPTRSKGSKMSELLDRLEAAYGTLVPSDDAVEAGLMALLAEHAPDLSRVQTRQLLREWVVDWNEMRVADPWDVSHAIQPGGHQGARSFARAALRMLGSVEAALNRCTFDRVMADPDADVDAIVDKLRGMPPHAKAVVKASLAGEGEWRLDKEASKLVQKLGLAGKTTSAAKLSKDLSSATGEADRLRAHYLLTRYVHRADDSVDPLTATPARESKSSSKKKAAPAKAATGSASKTAAKSAGKAAAKPAAKAAKKPVKKAAKKTAKKSAKGE